MTGKSPKGRYMIWLLAQQFRLDLQRGANLTEQSLLELDIENFSYNGLKSFVEKIEFVLNSIPLDHQPSERTKFTWLFGRVKRCKMIQRHVDRIKDASPTSHRRSFDWLFGKIKTALWELREDQNEDSIRNALSPSKPQKDRDKPKGANAATVEGEKDSGSSKAMPSQEAKPKAKQPGKGDGKGKGKKGEKPKGPPPPSKAQPTPKAKASSESKGKPTMPCLFYPKGTCNRGAECPFAHGGTSAAKEKAKPSKAAPAAKATVATVLASSASQVAGSSVSNASVLGAALRSAFAPFRFLWSVFATITAVLSCQKLEQVFAPNMVHPCFRIAVR